jgi:sortase (surface protein transpeptidase)
MKISRLIITAGAGLILAGAGLLFYLYRSQPVINETFNSKQYQSAARSNEISGMPDELLIPSLKMDLTVIPGHYNPITQTWNLTLNEVQYAVVTPEPNNIQGTTFFYGHYRPEVFAYLHLISANAQAIVKTTNNHTFYYQLASIRTTTPNDDSVFKNNGPPVLTVQTCTGPLFQYRQFYTFNLVRVT